MVDINNFASKKSKGLVKLEKVGASYALTIKKFNPEDGTEQIPIIIGISKTQILQQKETLTKAIKDLDDILLEMEE